MTLTKRLLYQLSYIGGMRTGHSTRPTPASIMNGIADMVGAVSKGTLTVICGPMFSGKSRELIRTVHIAQIAGQEVALFKARIDVRYSHSDVASHDGGTMTARSVDAAREIISFMRKAEGPGNDLVFVCNFTPVPRHNYRIGVPQSGYYREILNSDSSMFGESNVGNGGGVTADAIQAHHRPCQRPRRRRRVHHRLRVRRPRPQIPRGSSRRPTSRSTD